jgi:methylated-DNA-[protein]-cysteine S-methyltransferase
MESSPRDSLLTRAGNPASGGVPCAAKPQETPMLTSVCDSPLGPLTLASRDGKTVSGLRFGRKEGTASDCPPLRAAAAWLAGYFAGGRPNPAALPLAPEGTPFQRKVWAALLTIPYGETRSYGEIARLVASPSGRPCARAVGTACGRNPIPIIIPCHRVICSGGGIGGYSDGLSVKRRLLAREQPGQPAVRQA